MARAQAHDRAGDRAAAAFWCRQSPAQLRELGETHLAGIAKLVDEEVMDGSHPPKRFACTPINDRSGETGQPI